MPHDNLLIHLLARAQKSVRNHLADQFAQNNVPVTPMQARILFVLEKKSPCTMGELAKVLKADNASITRLVERLVKMGLARREANENDRRTVWIQPTKEGLDEVHHAQDLMRTVNKALEGGIASKDLETFRRVLAALANKFPDQPAQNDKEALFLDLHIEGLEEMCVPHALW